jgi:transposase, IS5 family
MRKQRTLAMITGFEQYTKKTRRAIFLEEMEQVVPWRELCALVEPHYPKPGNGRPPVVCPGSVEVPRQSQPA